MHQLYELAQDDAGRICAVPVGIAPRAIQEGVRKILVAEEDIDRGVGQRQRPKPVALIVRSQTSGGSGLEEHTFHLGQIRIEFVMQMRRVTGTGDGLLERLAELLFDRRTKCAIALHGFKKNDPTARFHKALQSVQFLFR